MEYHPPRCSFCTNRHYGICPNARNFDPMKAVVERDAEIALLRALHASGQMGTSSPARAEVPHVRKPKTPRALVPGTHRAQVFDLLGDGKERTSQQVADALGLPVSATASACSRLANDGRIVRVRSEGNTTVYARQ